jgi:antitoxin MazE
MSRISRITRRRARSGGQRETRRAALGPYGFALCRSSLQHEGLLCFFQDFSEAQIAGAAALAMGRPQCYYCDNDMSTAVLKISRIGNSRGIRLPAAMLKKYHIKDAVVAEKRPDEIALKPRRGAQHKLSWAETAKAMAQADEDWSEWDATLSDGIE